MCNYTTDNWDNQLNSSLPYNDTLDLPLDVVGYNSSLCTNETVNNTALRGNEGKSF